MSDKIKGVPEGWKIKRIGIDEDSKYYMHSDGEVKKVPDYILNNLSVASCCAVTLERDVKTIDMSKCKVDIETQPGLNGNYWVIDFPDSLRRHDLPWGKKCRVRQNHYFGWKGGERPLPDGLLIKLTNHFVADNCLNVSSIQALSHEADFDDPTLAGFEVLRPANGYAYEWELNN